MDNLNLTLYDILGRIPRHSTPQDIKTAYRELSKHYHPDVNQHDLAWAEEKMKALNEAYAVLSNPEKRAAYNEELRQNDEHIKQQEELKRRRQEEQGKANAQRQKQSANNNTQRKAEQHTHTTTNRMADEAEVAAGVAGVALAAIALGLLFAAFSDSDNE